MYSETIEAWRVEAPFGWMIRKGSKGPVYGIKQSFKEGEIVLSVSGPCDACVNARFRMDQVVPVKLRRTYIPAAAGLYDIVLEEVS